MTMYGRTDYEWAELVVAGTGFLRERARLGRTTSYTELDAALRNRTSHARFDFAQPAERAAIGELLGRIVRAELEADVYRPQQLMISALVIYLDGNDAGSGFYALASELGLFNRGTSKEAFWVGQLNGLYDHYRASRIA